LHLYYSVIFTSDHAITAAMTAFAVLTRLENILTYDTLHSLVRSDQNWQYNAAHLPHAADYTSRYENVLHCRWSAVWGRGRKKSKKLRCGHKSFVSPVASAGAAGPVWHVRRVFS
jgi:hypothetical protein